MRMLSYLLFILLLADCSKPDDPPVMPLVSIEGLTVDEGDTDKPVFVRLQLSEATTETVTAYIRTYDGTAKANEDYLPVDNAAVVFSPGSTISEYRIDLKGDDVLEPDESFTVRIENVIGGKIGTAEAVIMILNDESSVHELFIPPTGATSPLSYSGMTLVWQDEFSAAAPDPGNWTFEIGTGSNGWGNNESQYYRAENTTIVDGNLVIEAREESFGGRSYTSSRMITRDKFEFQYGRVDIRAALPFGQGIWPALWMLGHNISDIGWPACGEIDIMELIGHLPSTLHGTAHWSNAGQHAQYGGSTQLSSGTFHDEFHVFSLVWTETKLQWLLDNQVYHTMDITPAELSEFHQDYFFIFNVAVGGNWPGYPNQTTIFPQHLIVDYIRVFQEE